MDSIDLRILELLQSNARMANVDIARDLDMAPSAVLERIKKLEARQVIKSYEAKLSPKAIRLGLTAFLFVTSDDSQGYSKTANALASIPEVMEVHSIAGEDCFLVKLRVKDTEHLSELLKETVRKIPKLRSTRTTIVLETLKETGQMTLHHASQADES